MTHLRNGAILLAAVLALAACNNPGRFGADAGAGAAGAGGIAGPGITSGALGDPSNPTSIAYFNQTVGDRVFFALDQSTLSPEARATLTGQAQWLAVNTQYGAIVEGHADEQGTREYNLALGARRAAAVKDFLVAQGVAPGRIRTVSYGKERPVALCSNESCWAQNRRAVTVLNFAGGV
jgi:peptidoglycan-associated lipoprotein